MQKNLRVKFTWLNVLLTKQSYRNYSAANLSSWYAIIEAKVHLPSRHCLLFIKTGAFMTNFVSLIPVYIDVLQLKNTICICNMKYENQITAEEYIFTNMICHMHLSEKAAKCTFYVDLIVWEPYSFRFVSGTNNILAFFISSKCAYMCDCVCRWVIKSTMYLTWLVTAVVYSLITSYNEYVWDVST